jgi:hypothetical protein
MRVLTEHLIKLSRVQHLLMRLGISRRLTCMKSG